MKHTYALLTLTLIGNLAQGQTIFYEGFDDVASLAGNGWVLANHSEPLGNVAWAQAEGSLDALAYSGDSLSYAQSNYQATDEAGTGTISDWMITPEVTLDNGDMIRLFALSYNSATFPDRIEVRISTNGGSDIGTASGDVGDFTTLVFSINEDLDTVSFPSVTSGDDWTAFEAAVSGLGGPTACRIAVRYYVVDAGGTGANSSTVGVDDLEVYSGQSTVGISELTEGAAILFPNPANDEVTIKFNALKGKATVTLMDPSGHVYSSGTLGEVYQRSVVMDTHALASGAYTVSVVQEGASLWQRLVVVH